MPEQPHSWLHLIISKSPESWLSIIGGSIYVWIRSGNIKLIGRSLEAGLSGLISVALGPDIISATGYPAPFVYFSIAVLGFLVLDTFMSILADKEELKTIAKGFIRKWLGVNIKQDKEK